MGLEKSITTAWTWAKKEPSVFLASILNWIPGLAFSIVALFAAPWIRDIIASNPQNPLAAMVAHSAELTQLILPFLGLLLMMAALTILTKSLVSLALAHAARQFYEEKPLSLSNAFGAARKRWLSFIGAELILLLIGLAIVLLAAMFTIVLAGNPIGIIVLLILAIPAILLTLAAIIVVAAMLLYLPAILAFGNSSAWSGLKAALRFVDQNKMASAGLVVSTFLAQGILGYAINTLGGPIASTLDLLVQLFVGTLSALAATGYWLDVQKDTANESDKPHEEKAVKTAPANGEISKYDAKAKGINGNPTKNKKTSSPKKSNK